MYGKRPKKLLKKININKEIKIMILEKEYLIKILNSLNIKLIILVQNNIKRDGINQNWNGKNINIKIILIQFKEIYVEVDGSKIEKIFIIIYYYHNQIQFFFIDFELFLKESL